MSSPEQSRAETSMEYPKNLSSEQQASLQEVQKLRTFCQLEEESLTLDRFEETHPHITLSDN